MFLQRDRLAATAAGAAAAMQAAGAAEAAARVDKSNRSTPGSPGAERDCNIQAGGLRGIRTLHDASPPHRHCFPARIHTYFPDF